MSDHPSDCEPRGPFEEPKTRLFLSYGRADAEELAERLEGELSLLGYEVWRDKRQIRAGKVWDDQIEAGLRTSQLVVAVLTPHAVREESVCRDELAFARFACKLPIVPALAAPCEPPFVIFRLDYIDLTAWRDSDDQYKKGFKRLIDSIQAYLRGELPRYRRWDDRFRQFDFGPYLYDKRQDFCGREWLFRRIDEWRIQSGRQRALLITGDPGIGKSAIVAQLVHLNPGGQVLAYHCCRAGLLETLRPARFVRAIAGMIASQLEGYAAQLDVPKVQEALSLARCETDPASAFEEGLLEPLHRVHTPPEGNRYILVDALDEALSLREGMNLVQLLRRDRLERLPGWLRVVATTRQEPDVLRRLAGLQAEEIRADAPDNLDDIERYLAYRLGKSPLAKRLETSGLAAAETTRRLREKSAGSFLWVTEALRGIDDGRYAFDRLEELPPGLVSLYADYLDRAFPDERSFAPARRVLEIVLAAREPLTGEEIAQAAGNDSGPTAETLEKLIPYLPERDGRRSPYHKSFADWLTDLRIPHAAGRFHIDVGAGAQPLADWCWGSFQHGSRRMLGYPLRHLPALLYETQRWDDLMGVLLDIGFLESKTEKGYIFDLARDFIRTLEALPLDHPSRRHLRLISQSLGADIHFLSRHPTALFQCLWNRGWWYDCPEAAAHHRPPPAESLRWRTLGSWIRKRIGRVQSHESPPEGPPWARPEVERVSTRLSSAWHVAKETRSPRFPWLRSLRPPPFPLGGAELACLRGHESGVNSVAFDRAGGRIVSGSGDRTVRVWDAATGAELACLRGHESVVTSVAFDRAGGRIVSGSWDQTVRVWDAATGAELACLRGHEHWVTSVAFDRAGERIVSGSVDGTARVWDAATGAELACLRGHEGVVRSVAFDRTGGRIVSGSIDGTVRVWDAASGAELGCLRAHESWVRSVAFDRAGGRIVSGSHDGTVRVWDAATGAELACLRGHEKGVYSVAFDRAGGRIVSGSHDGTVRVWDAATGAELACLRGHESGVNSVAFDRAGGRIVSGCADQTVRVWDATTGVELACLRGHELEVTSVAFDRAGGLIVSGSDDRTVRVWDAAMGAELACLRGHEHWVTSVAFDRAGGRIVSGSADRTVRVWDTATGAELACLRGHERRVTSVAFDRAGGRIVSGSGDETVRVWDAATGAELACLRGHENVVTSVGFDRAGERVVSGSWDGTVWVWDATTGACPEVIQGTGDVAAIAEGFNEAGEFPWRAVNRGNETVIEPAAGGEPVAWFPVALLHISTHPSGRIWAGSVANHLYIIQLEGEPEPKPSGSKRQ
jgi:WD40 repeat protein